MTQIKSKMALITVTLYIFLNSAIAHSNSDYSPSMMGWSDGGMMHNAGHMIGYNIWGMGWPGAVLSLAFWTLAILGIIYLYQELIQDKEDGGEQ